MSAYGVPIYMYISTLSTGNIKNIMLKGLKLPSLLDEISTDSISEEEILELKLLSDDLGDLHHLFAFKSIDEDTGDSINVLSNYFYLNIAPMENKVIDIVVTATIEANNRLNVWMTIPNDTVQPYIVSERGIINQYCCVKDRMECLLNITADVSGLISKLPGTWGMAGKITECVTSSLSSLSSTIGYWVCREEGDPSPFNYNSMAGNTNSAASLIMKCFKQVPGAFEQLKALLEGKGFEGLSTFLGIAQDINDCVSAFTQPKPNCPPGDPSGGPSNPVNSYDPNDIRGYLSESGSHYMPQEIQNIHYEIEFENDTTLATAAAHTIIVRDTLDATKFDLNSLAAHSVTVGDKRLELNGEQTFAKTLDMRPELYVIAQVEQEYDPATGIIQWTISSLDPMTMEPTDNPFQGVLPVNYYGDGAGFIDYSVNLKQMFADGTEISNRAGIIFDNEDMIMTPTWTNIVDAVKPTSHIAEVEQVTDTLNFTFSSTDDRSGVWYHTLYYRNASTGMEWSIKKNQIFGDNYKLNLENIQVTEYCVMATDSAGNKENKNYQAEYVFAPNGLTLHSTPLTTGWNWYSTYIEQTGINGLAQLESSINEYGTTIKTNGGFVMKRSNGWLGSLAALDNAKGYKVNVTAPSEAQMQGYVADPADHPITIKQNWNWIGYPVSIQQTVATALAGFTPTSGDILKRQSGFVTFRNGQWMPSGFVMTPGQMYLYYSKSAENKTLVFANSRETLEEIQNADLYWNANITSSPNNICVMAVVNIDGVEQRDENIELGAFVNGECRGNGKLYYVNDLDRYIAFLTVTGEDGDVISFSMVNNRGEVSNNSDTRIMFQDDAIIGDFENPFEVNFNKFDNNSMSLYPNPVDRNAEITLSIPDNEKIAELIITNAFGAEVMRQTNASGNVIKGLSASGVYNVQIITVEGNIYHGKVIVR